MSLGASFQEFRSLSFCERARAKAKDLAHVALCYYLIVFRRRLRQFLTPVRFARTNRQSAPIKFWRHRIFAASATRARLYHERDGEDTAPRLRGVWRCGGIGVVQERQPNFARNDKTWASLGDSSVDRCYRLRLRSLSKALWIKARCCEVHTHRRVQVLRAIPATRSAACRSHSYSSLFLSPQFL